VLGKKQSFRFKVDSRRSRVIPQTFNNDERDLEHAMFLMEPH